MTTKDDVRKGFLGGILPKVGKAERPAPEQADVLGNKKPKVVGEKKSITVWMDPVAIRQFKTLAREQDMKIEDLMGEAFNLVFAKYHKGEIA